VDALGNPVDSQSGAPAVLINPFLGLSDTLYRMRIGTASLRHHWPRDVLTLTGTWQSQDPMTSANNAVSVASTRGTYATLSWGHELSPRTTGVAAAQYGRVSGQLGFGQPGFGQPSQGDTDTYALSATLMHQLNDKLTGTIQVAWTNNTSSVANQGYTQGVIRAGLRRTF
jgi:uncharacterized protein (PEP-CTERM system associated)